jgi:ABC-type antimicrobial peptide transport system permease subunit
VITAAGIFSLIAFITIRRTKEIAIRFALGASASQVLWLVTRSAAMAAVVGSIVGGVFGTILVRALRATLFGVTVNDPRLMAAAAIVITLTAALASWLPTRRALRIDPNETLRHY